MRLAHPDAPAFEGEADIDSSIASCRFRIIESDAIGRSFPLLPTAPVSGTKDEPVESNDINKTV
jgi:hypothetical protein